MKILAPKRKINLWIILSFGKMKIDKENFNKLKQLDRIEYRQRWNQISEIGFSFGNVLFYILIMFSIFSVGAILSQNSSIASLALDLLTISAVLLFVEILLVIGFSYKKSKLRRELNNEYFKVEVKK